MGTHLNQLYLPQFDDDGAVGQCIKDGWIEIDGYVEWLQANHPNIDGIINDVSLLSAAEREEKIRAIQACQDFSEHGRGKQWATTVDQHLEVRKTGASMLLKFLTDAPRNANGAPARPYVLLDVFGGSGFIAQFARDVVGCDCTVVTSDPSVLMVRLALSKKLPVLWQRAQDLFMTRSDSLDAVLFAYGTHHIPVEERLQSFKEVWRVLKPGGVFVCHDFEESGPTARWFAEVVDPHTFTGHKHAHFTVESMSGYYTGGGFVETSIVEIDDCFQFSAPDREAAHAAAIDFMGAAYGLEKLERSAAGARLLWRKIQEIFPLDEILPGSGAGAGYQLVIHRPALLGVGRKPLG